MQEASDLKKLLPDAHFSINFNFYLIHKGNCFKIKVLKNWQSI